MRPSIRLLGCFVALGASAIALFAFAQEKKKEPPTPGAEPPKEAAAKSPKFVSADAGKYFSGDLVIVDAINHRGALRLDGDGPLHYFAMLPYGMVGYNGAPAELRGVPLGTHMHGYFHLPPAGEEETIPLHQRSQPHNHALTLEDDFTYYQRRGQAWKIAAIDLKKGKLDVVATGKLVKDGINGKYTFDIDNVTRVWKERKLVDLDLLAPEQTVQLNLSWAQGAVNKEFTVTDVWLDDVSRKFATEMQRRRHVRYQQQRWLPGWIDHVEHFDYGGAIITITLFGGMDQSLYDDMKATRETGYWVAAAEKTLRTWFHRADRKVGRVQDWKDIENPPLGSSGIQLRLKFAEVLEGYRPGRIVRLKCDRWREEYGHTVYDLLGVYYDVNLPGAFNDDPRWHGFDRIGSLLSLSPSHVERYFKAAEAVLDRAFPVEPPKSQKTRREADDGKWKAEGHAGPVRWLMWPDHGQHLLNVTSPGLYRIRIQLSGLPSFKGRVPHLTLWHHEQKKSILGRDVQAPEGEPTIVEIEAFLPEGAYTIKNESPGMFSDQHTLSNTNFTFRSTRTTLQNRPTGYKFFNEEGQPIYPLLLVDWVEMDGPVLTETDKKKRDGLLPVKDGDLAEAHVALKRFATHAWRRPATDAELERYLKLLQGELKAGENFRSAYRSAMVGILTSKNFYYLEEGSPTEKRDRVTDWELASRLSYFLWSSIPDGELFTAARSGTLDKPEVLRTQLTRMLGDAKINRFTNAFPKQWLQLHRVGQFPADPELYPDYDKWLEESMVLETALYFDTVFRENLPLREFIASDWTMLNPRLAMHYGMPALKTTNFQKVKLRPENHRGGVLTHASVLSLTSDGTRHRPVHRGVWVSEAIFGRTPPPPPPNVEPLAPTPSNKPKATIRNQLEAHTTHAICASCHAKIDPLGFAFDSFDAIGRWRTHEQVQGGQGDNPSVDTGGVLRNGRAFKGTDDFKQLLVQDLDRFAEAFVEQLATFALRRVMTVDDAVQIKAIAQASKKDGYQLRTVIENLVLSELFQKR